MLDEVHLLRQANFMIEAQRIAGEIGTRDNLSALCADALAMMLLSGATRSKYREENGNRPPPWLLRARDLLNDEWRNTVRLTDVAREVGVHPAHLARTFSAYFGESIGSYLRKLRLNWALAQLTARDGPIAPVALEAGFSDQSHFTRECRRHMGVTPAAYRARAVANAE
ncbi:MAG: AraC family transcriptional regulator [Gemmatimonadaceae bacterium]